MSGAAYPLGAVDAARDAIDTLSGDAVREVRALRPVVRDGLAAADTALFDPADGDFSFPVSERLIVALYVAALHQDSTAIAVFGERAHRHGVGRHVEEEAIALAERHLAVGPYGDYRSDGPLAAESVAGPDVRIARESVFGLRLSTALEFANRVLLHPRDTDEPHLELLRDAGWSGDQIVILTQVVAVLAFELRVATGLRALAAFRADRSAPVPALPARSAARPVGVEARPIAGATPHRFTQHVVAWQPWLQLPIADDGFDWVASFGKRRASSPSFRLSARDPRVSLPLAQIEDDVFGASDDGLTRGERELAALAVSRLNGCLYCASVHSRSTVKFTGLVDPVQRILDGGVNVELGDRWNTLVHVATDLTRTPSSFGAGHVRALVELGLDEVSVLDLVHSVGYFNFANRIMLTLGRPVFP